MDTKLEKQNSFCFRYNGTGTEVKIYFDTSEDLVFQLQKFLERSVSIRVNLDKIKKEIGGDKK